MNHIFIWAGIAVVVIFLFLYKNPYRSFINFVSLFLGLAFICISLWPLLPFYEGALITIISCIGLSLSYCLRFISKPVKGFIDYAKLVSMLFFSAAVYGKYIFETRHPLPLLDILFVVSAALAIHCFIIDRVVLDEKIMNRNFKYALILSLQTLVSVIFLVYAMFLQAEAESQRAEAVKASIAEQQAIVARIESMKDLEECQRQRSDK